MSQPITPDEAKHIRVTLRTWRNRQDPVLSLYRIAKDLGVAQETVRQWDSGDNTPQGANMEKLIAYTKGAVTADSFFVDAIDEAQAAS